MYVVVRQNSHNSYRRFFSFSPRKFSVSFTVGTEFKTTSIVCTTCATGTYQEQNEAASVSCKFCAAGKAFASTTTACESCGAGKYQEQVFKAATIPAKLLN